jgi:hypothetical protein
LRIVPSGALDTGSGVVLFAGVGSEVPPSGVGEGLRGVEKGCAAPVDVTVGGPLVRGDAGVAEGGVWASRDVLENERMKREGTLRRRQREQIMIGGVEGN